MWEKINKTILYFFKNIQFTLRTWKNALEISRAYAPSSAKGISVSQVIKEGLLWIFIITVIILLVGIAYNRFSEMKKHQTITDRLTESIGKKTSPPEGEGEKSGSIDKQNDSTAEAPEPDSARVEAPQTAVRPEVVIFNYIPTDDTSDYLILVANKAVRSMYVLQKHGSAWRVIKEYTIAVGEQEGRKVTAGDRRTPEGQYFIVGRKEQSELASIYGPLVYVLDYPNEEDRHAGRTGQGIWIHGTDPDSSPLQTRGCIEMENQNLIELATLLKRGIGTPVTIVCDPNLQDIASAPDFRLCDERRRIILKKNELVEAEFRKLLVSWKTSWERKNLKVYKSFYDTVQFIGQGLDWKGWKERKLRTFGLYDTIAIRIENIMISGIADHSMIVKFLQHYQTNLNSIENGKKLSFKKIDDAWKIVRESTCPKEELLL
ncbi:MAG: L,D-transpeptidase family protein [Chitinispirillaceae bacterium]|nr:L,D-transpeptidase family protein [Chitinispirillaceae bacterium]